MSSFRKLELANRHINERVRNGRAYEDAWNESSIELTAAAEAHCRGFIVKTFFNTVSNLNGISNELKTVLVHLMQLYSVHIALKLTGDLLRVNI